MEKSAGMENGMVHKITGWIFGYLMVYLEHEGAGRFINLCRNNGIEIWNIRADEEKKILWFNIGFRNFWRIHHIAVKCHVFPRVYKRYGLLFLIERSKKNLNFVLGVISFFTMLFFLSSRIWGIEVAGQNYYTKENIISYLDTENIYGGMCSGRADCKKIEKNIRKKYDKIGWVSVNRSGSRLVVNVREMSKDDIEKRGKPANLVASDDGKVVSIVTSAGVAKVKTGKKVKAGRVLISGVVPIVGDNDEIIRKSRVKAEGIVVLESREMFYGMQKKRQKRKVYTGRTKEIYKISAFGKEFFIHNPLNDLETSKKCAILYEGGCVCPFLSKRFPISVWKITYKKYEYVYVNCSLDEARQCMKDEYTDYIRKKEKKGYKLVKTDFSVSEQGDCYKASGNITWQKKQTHYEKIKKVKQKRNNKYGNNGNSSGNTG